MVLLREPSVRTFAPYVIAITRLFLTHGILATFDMRQSNLPHQAIRSGSKVTWR